MAHAVVWIGRRIRMWVEGLELGGLRWGVGTRDVDVAKNMWRERSRGRRYVCRARLREGATVKVGRLVH